MLDQQRVFFLPLCPIIRYIQDAEKNSYNISLDQIKKKITKKTKAVFLVHSAGEVVRDIINITNFLYKSKIFLIEDTSQCPGGSINGRKVGTFGDVCCLSTMYRKSLYGGSSGGIVFTKKKNITKKFLPAQIEEKNFGTKNITLETHHHIYFQH